MGKTLRRWKRRKGGVYAWRTRKHLSLWRREWGYVGESNSFRRRELDYRGQTAYQRSDGTVQQSTEKPWMDLDPKCYRVISLPVVAVLEADHALLETLIILLLWPRYNQAKNRWNPRRVSLTKQRQQRMLRDAADGVYRLQLKLARAARWALQGAGGVLICLGVVMTVVHR